MDRAVLVAASLALAACGGGGGDGYGGGSGSSSASSPGGGYGDGGMTYTVGGMVSGLTGTVVLGLYGADSLSISRNGPFTFQTPLVDGTAYTVLVLTQPMGQTCSVANSVGNSMGGNITNVT